MDIVIMQRSTKKKLLINSFLLSVLLHLLLLLSFAIIIFQPEEKKKSPNLQVTPTYYYSEPLPPKTLQSLPATAVPSQQQSKPTPVTPLQQDKSPLKRNELPQQVEKNISPEKDRVEKSVMSATRQVLRENLRHAIKSIKDEDPIYLIGDENVPTDPLVKMIGKALSANFEYPKVAGEFGITGRVLIGLTLHPEGNFSDVQLLKSSNNNDLDAAALYAVNTAPNVAGAERFLSEPKHFVVGFIFKLMQGPTD